MNVAETRAEHIDPALKAAGWGVVEDSQLAECRAITRRASRRACRCHRNARYPVRDCVFPWRARDRTNSELLRTHQVLPVNLEPGRDVFEQPLGLGNTMSGRGIIYIFTSVIGQITFAPQRIDHRDSRRR